MEEDLRFIKYLDSIEDYLICEKCETDMVVTKTDKVEFLEGNNGCCFVEATCPHCRSKSAFYLNFDYRITKKFRSIV